MSTRHDKSEFLSFASCQLVAESNEDRISTCMNHGSGGFESFSSFGVFDGHQGAAAAERCSTRFNDTAVGYYNKLTLANKMNISMQANSLATASIESVDSVPSSKLSSPSDQRDAIVCEAIRKACSQIGHDFKGTSEAGCTVNTLFLQWDDHHRGPAGTVKCPVRAFCANVGDSRCVMLRSYETKDALVTSSSFGMHSKSTPELTLAVEPETHENEILPPTLADKNDKDKHDKHKPSLGKGFHSVSSLSALTHSHGHHHGQSPTSPKSNRFVAVHLMSEDHKLTLHRERLRILNAAEGKTPVGNETEYWHTLPADASAIYLPHYAKTLPPPSFVGLPDCGLLTAEFQGEAERPSGPFGRRGLSASNSFSSASSHGRLDGSIDTLMMESSHGQGLGLGYSTHSVMSQSMHSNSNSFHGLSSHHGNGSQMKSNPNKYFIFDWGYPAPEIEGEAGRFIATVTDVGPASPASMGSSEKDKQASILDLQASAAPDEPNGPPLCYKISFIKKRSNRDGNAIGPEALFSRHNTSIMMTRSMGDRFGPRSCIAVPEISAYTIPVDTHVRFILASDGFWDVVSVETVRCVGLSDKFRDPRLLAAQLAQKAQRRRDRAGMRMDDISVIVVDVNPNNFIAVHGKTGGDGFIKGPGGGKEKCSIS